MLAKLPTDAKVIWFLLVGGLNTALGFGLFPSVYWLFENYRQHYVWTLVICHIITVSFSYITNKVLVFRASEQSFSEMVKFGSFHLLYFLMMIFLVPVFVEYMHCNPMVIQFFISVLVVITSFFWYDKVVFLLPRD